MEGPVCLFQGVRCQCWCCCDPCCPLGCIVVLLPAAALMLLCVTVSSSCWAAECVCWCSGGCRSRTDPARNSQLSVKELQPLSDRGGDTGAGTRSGF